MDMQSLGFSLSPALARSGLLMQDFFKTPFACRE